VISVTPSGGWIPAFVAGSTGVGLSQRMQSFVLDERINPFNVVAPGKRPRATLTPSLALKDGEPIMAFSVQGGDTQDQNLLQFFLNVVEFGMNVQQAADGKARLPVFRGQQGRPGPARRQGRQPLRDDVAWACPCPSASSSPHRPAANTSTTATACPTCWSRSTA
jgi:hypothetical protein